MNLYIRTLGFDNMTSEAEAKFIKTGIRESIKEGFVIRHEKLDRGVIILRLSNSTGLYVYGRYEKNIFKYEYYFPFVVGKALSDNEEMTIERHLDKESYAVICDELKTGVTLIFYLQNVMDYLDYLYSGKDFNADDFNPDRKNEIGKVPIRNKKVALTGLSLGGIIMLPVRKERNSKKSRQDEIARKNLIQAAKNGDEDAIESLTIEDIDTYNELSNRVMKEDIFTIVDSTFMPCGVECDQYSVIGEILELREEENIYTGEKIYIMVLECNSLIITTAVNKEHLLGEPAVGRRFKGQIWLQGNVGKSVVKRVKIRNEGSVACYIRAALIFSEPIEAIEGLDTKNWVKGEDDYYYYKKPVSEGESTTELFTGIRVAKEMEQKELEVSVYEESVQIQKGNMVFHGYREAWDAYERGGQT